MKGRDVAVRARLTTWLIDQRHLGVECPRILDNIPDEVEHRRPLPEWERADRLLRCLRENSPNIGSRVEYRESGPMAPVAWRLQAYSESITLEELGFLLAYLEKRGWVDEVDTHLNGGRATLSVDGYIRLAELQKAVVDSSQAFVAMWIDASTDAAWIEGIEPGVGDAGYGPLRIDKKEHSNKIDDEIIAEIRRSRFVVADFTQGDTGHRGGVYYEAGFAHGLNIPVIFTCRSDVIEAIHFDTRQYNHIVWETPAELREKLALRIAAVIGDGPLKRDSGR